MKIVSLKICPFVQRVTALLEAKNIPYEIEYISLMNKPEWFLKISPNAQVPLLIADDGTVLFESDAIAEYLEDAYPALQPELSAEERATNRAWSYLAAKNYLVQCGAQRSPDAETLAERGGRLGAAFDKMEARLGDTPYFGGETLGMVDIAWLPLLHRAEIIARRSGYDFLRGRLRMKAWQGRLLETGLAEKSVAPDFEEVFSDFYLNDETLLGRGEADTLADAGPVQKSGSCC